jgi:hypothetical protein
MSNNLGIFLNNTNSEVKYNINIINYNNLKNNFQNIIVIDINNEYSEKLNNYIKDDNQKNDYIIKIIKYEMDNKYFKDIFDDFESNKIMNILNDLKYVDYNYITFINDNYIYCGNLKDYFDYVNNHKLEFYSYTDSTENKYHFQLYLFSINSLSVIKLLDLLNKNDNDILFKIPEIFLEKMPYLKIGYLKYNLGNNIFFNNHIDIYKDLIEHKLLPIININKLYLIKDNFKDTTMYTIPIDFDINFYKSADLSHLDNEEIEKHFINHGQFEFRLYKKNNFIYNDYLRVFLKQYNILNYFDVPDDFDLLKYRANNEDLKDLSFKKLIIHWVNYGYNEQRIYK